MVACMSEIVNLGNIFTAIETADIIHTLKNCPKSLSKLENIFFNFGISMMLLISLNCELELFYKGSHFLNFLKVNI